MKKLLLCILSFWILFFSFSLKTVAAKEPTQLHAISAVLMDGESGRVLYEKNGKEFRSNASTTKILTCILALELGNPEDQVTVSQYASTMPDVQLNIRQGEKYYLKDMLYSLMLESHNDTAVAIAEHIAGSCEEFARIMNKKAEEIGCTDTYFITPNGLDASMGERSHGTNAVDLSKIMRYCIFQSPCREEFLKLTRVREHTFTDTEKKRSFTCYNRNSFLSMMEGALTGKTGFTQKAGYCYIGALRRDQRTYIVALLGCGWPSNKNYKWQDCQKLMEYGLENYQRYELKQLQPEPEVVKGVVVQNGQNSQGEYQVSVPIVLEEKQQSILLKEGEKIQVKVEKYPQEAPLRKGSTVGRIRYLIDEQVWLEQKIYTRKKVEKIDYDWCLSILIQKIFS